MLFIKRLGAKFHTIGEVLAFFWQRKLWWMIPMLIVLLLVGLLLVLGGSSPLAPFIYTLF
jgi:hypothetical protein